MEKLESNGLTVVDFFCGAGIGAVGFKLAGFNIIDAFDNKDYAVNSYNRNIGNHARIADVRKLQGSDVPDADIYVGGFPCTPFSLAGSGKGKEDSKNGDLGYHFFRLVKENRPNAFIIENVKGMISKKHKPFFDELVEGFESEGYTVSWELLNCYDHGVAQLRERVFIVGIKNEFGVHFQFPAPVDSMQKTTLRDALSGLPQPSSNHSVANHTRYYDGGFSPRYTSRNRQKQWNEPSFTIVASDRQLPLYPEPANFDIRRMDEYTTDPPRRFTVRECLRIQSVPDWFSFSDDIPLTKQYERCSGIPSLIAYKLSDKLANYLRSSSSEDTAEKEVI